MHTGHAHIITLVSCSKLLCCQFHSVAISHARTLTFVTPGSPPAGLTLTAARHVVATRTVDAVTAPLTALSKESLGTGFRRNTQALAFSTPQSSVRTERFLMLAYQIAQSILAHSKFYECRTSLLLRCCYTEMLANAAQMQAERRIHLFTFDFF